MEMMLWLDSILPAARKLLRSRIKVLTPDLYYLVLVKVSKERILKKDHSIKVLTPDLYYSVKLSLGKSL